MYSVANLAIGGRSGIENAKTSSSLRRIDNAAASIGLGPASRVLSHEAIVCGNERT
jgi:hypothetical protein